MSGQSATSGAYLCLECTARSDFYTGQCGACQAWGTLVLKPSGDEASIVGASVPRPQDVAFQPERIHVVESVAARAGVAPWPAIVGDLPVLSLSAARVAEAAAPRVPTGIAELDRVLGGGLVDGSVVLLGGSPGCGKSTMLLQVADALVRVTDSRALYASGEENEPQIALRAQRIGVDDDRISLAATGDVDRVVARASTSASAVLVVDSIQTMKTSAIDSPAGSALQVVEVVARVARFAKETRTPAILIGHVTKDGEIAGPKTLEHLVDVVLYLDGQGAEVRRLTSPKNRHGNAAEVGSFEMTERGLVGIEDGTAVLERPAGACGSVVFPAIVGERCELVEIQALVGAPKPDERPRGSVTASGVDAKRVLVILAILQRHAAIDLSDRDVFVATGGGARVTDPAADLAIACAIASSARDRPVLDTACCFGELGLAGEVRLAVDGDRRAQTAERRGFPIAIGRSAVTLGSPRTVAQAIEQALAVAGVTP